MLELLKLLLCKSMMNVDKDNVLTIFFYLLLKLAQHFAKSMLKNVD